MRKTRLFMFCGAAALALGVAGCNREAMDTEPATTADTAAADTATLPADTATDANATGAESLTLATGSNGQYLADASGRAVYMLEGDGECVGECLTVWPPVVVTTSTPVVGANLQSGLVSTVQRDDGTLQLTYNGHPLYYYARDTGTGMAMGQAVDDDFGEWYLVGPGGIALTDVDASAGVTAEAPMDDDDLDATDDMAPPAPVDDTDATDDASGNAPQSY
jgi:predicted lipoprotein with Yx(FWY)xxD motif